MIECENKKSILKHTQGFTLAELLIMIAILSILMGIIFSSIQGVRTRTRDIIRLTSLDAFKDALALYYRDHGKYPNSDSVAHREGFSYLKHSGSGPAGCNLLNWYDQSYNPPLYPDPADSLRIDNSVSTGFISELFSEGYMGISDWHDPSNPTRNYDMFNCRYIVPMAEAIVDNVQHYFLHCNLEANESAEANDGGFNDTVYEIMKPNPWICICGENGKGGDTVAPMLTGTGDTCP